MVAGLGVGDGGCDMNRTLVCFAEALLSGRAALSWQGSPEGEHSQALHALFPKMRMVHRACALNNGAQDPLTP